MQATKKRISYFYPHASTFIVRDLELLGAHYEVSPYEFSVRVKWKLPIQFLKQLFYILFRTKDAFFVCHFAGYASLLPVLLGRIFGKKVFVIVAGNDGSRFPDFKYGNFTKKLLGWATKTSLRFATHIMPVAQGLVYQDYNYYPGGAPAQGFHYFAPKTKSVPYTVIPYGFNIDLFRIDEKIERPERSFITIGNLKDPYCYFRKGFDLIIELAKRNPTWQITIIGWEPNGQEVPANIQLIPFSPISVVISYLQKHRYYFQLSVMEGFPNALGEAMACGCVPIGSHVSGIPELIGDTGLILSEKNVVYLERSIELLFQQDFEQASLKARKRIEEHFLPAHREAKMLGVFEKYC
ncbi:MAG: glycosyltransferase family 4 protein [Flavobacteriales bacterium]